MGTVYLIGEVVGALMFGRLSDKLGRRSLFMWTLAIYLVGTGLSALAFKGTGGMVYFCATRFIVGSGIGGEYSAINSAIDEMMPARYRGRHDQRRAPSLGRPRQRRDHQVLPPPHPGRPGKLGSEAGVPARDPTDANAHPQAEASGMGYPPAPGNDRCVARAERS
jgi:hypothetical protein